MRVVVTSAYSQSFHAVAQIHGLAQQGHQVVMCLNVSVVNFKRFKAYLRNMGWKKLWRMATNRLSMGRTGSPMAKEIAPMTDYLTRHGIPSRTVQQACRATGARHVKVKSLNAPECLAILREANADLVVYAGGGLLQKEFLDIPRLGVVNAHGGPLPQFRGMDAVNWPLLHGVNPAITVHYVDPGVDTGPIILQNRITADSWQDIFAQRGQATCVAVESLLQGVSRIAAGTARAQPQDLKAGRRFPTMAEPLIQVLRRWIDEGKTPQISPEDFHFPEPLDSLV
jgi:folate-dependent phosphoribosylglycinamide formyltransferase PurN